MPLTLELSGRPGFQMPFPCGQTWAGQTRTNRSPMSSIDFNRADDYGDKVVASAAGTVSRVANTGSTSYGRWIEIKHGAYLRSRADGPQRAQHRVQIGWIGRERLDRHHQVPEEGSVDHRHVRNDQPLGSDRHRLRVGCFHLHRLGRPGRADLSVSRAKWSGPASSSTTCRRRTAVRAKGERFSPRASSAA
jgi:hypothetical protein